MAAPEVPPGFVVQQEAKKAAWDNGYRLPKEVSPGCWLRFGSTTARGDIWIAGDATANTWFLSLEHTGVAVELAALPRASTSGPGIATYSFNTLTALHATLDRVYRLAVSLPDAPLDRFRSKIANMPRTTEAERLVVQRVGQDVFRDALIDYWDGRCAVTGLAVTELLRASHIKPWADCETDDERLDVFNGFLFAPNLDAAFDRGFITVDDEGTILLSPRLPAAAASLLGFEGGMHVIRLTEQHRTYLGWHRKQIFKSIQDGRHEDIG